MIRRAKLYLNTFIKNLPIPLRLKIWVKNFRLAILTELKDIRAVLERYETNLKITEETNTMNDSKNGEEDFGQEEQMRLRSMRTKLESKDSGLPDDPKLGNGESTTEAYYVEVRCTSTIPKVIPTEHERMPMVITDKWQRVPTYGNHYGIGVTNRLLCPVAEQQGLLSYEAARAIEYQFTAQFGFASCIETRLMLVKPELSFSLEFIGYAPVTNTFEDSRQLKWKIQSDRKEAMETYEQKCKLQGLLEEEAKNYSDRKQDENNERNPK